MQKGRGIQESKQEVTYMYFVKKMVNKLPIFCYEDILHEVSNPSF